MRKCPHCSKKVSETARKCRFCGKRITEEFDAPEKIGTKEKIDTAELTYLVGTGKMLMKSDVGEDNLKNEDTNTNKILEICLIGLIILGVLLVVIAFIVG